MFKYFLIGVVVVAVAALVVWFMGPRVVRTVALISIISPYEQVGEGQQSILVLGDSTGYGTGARRSSESVAGHVGADFPAYRIENDSVNGRTIGELVSVAQGVREDYRLILLQIGGNDVLNDRPVAEVEAELRTIVAALRDNAEYIVMISSGNVGAAAAFTGQPEKAIALEARSRTFRDMFLRVASETELTYIDLFQEREVDPFVEHPQQYLSVDGLHPSSSGYAYWYKSLRPVLLKYLDY